MGRELRMVPKNWMHPIDDNRGRHKPLRDGKDFREKADAWLSSCILWSKGEHPSQKGDHSDTALGCRYFWDWDGGPPREEDHMLVGVPESERTHFMLYETTSEGTPCNNCPAFETLDELCAWAERNATTFASFKATFSEWKEMLSPGGLVCAKAGNVMFL